MSAAFFQRFRRCRIGNAACEHGLRFPLAGEMGQDAVPGDQAPDAGGVDFFA